MATEDFSAQLRTVNESGFPLQIAVRHLVDSAKPGGWRLRYTEHAWREAENGTSGFIDLVLQNQWDTAYLVVECKRVRDVDWIFLAEDGNPRSRRQCKCWVSRFLEGSFKFFGWEECPLDPPSREAAFCVVRGQTPNGQRPMLERVASEVVIATEAVARQERDFRPPNRDDIFRTYVSVIVTTAPLLVGTFDPAAISLFDGTMDGAKFESVPYVRFRKQLSGGSDHLPPSYKPASEVAASRESTVFVVNAEHMAQFLGEFKLDDQAARRFA
jgi:hypothetical protein